MREKNIIHYVFGVSLICLQFSGWGKPEPSEIASESSVDAELIELNSAHDEWNAAISSVKLMLADLESDHERIHLMRSFLEANLEYRKWFRSEVSDRFAVLNPGKVDEVLAARRERLSDLANRSGVVIPEAAGGAALTAALISARSKIRDENGVGRPLLVDEASPREALAPNPPRSDEERQFFEARVLAIEEIKESGRSGSEEANEYRRELMRRALEAASAGSESGNTDENESF